jgi:NADPH:quinone reductase-like Zn-dependent oxidoreductase
LRAVLLEEHLESPGSVTVSDVPQPSPLPGELLVRIEAAAINPSDVLNIRGGFPHTKLPRIVGRDFGGRVEQGPPHLSGREVWGCGGGDLGYTHDGTHAEFVALPDDGVALRPARLSAEDAAASGIPYVTAWIALVERAQIRRDEWVVISGAAGAVGYAAVQIAHYAGARVIALILNESERGGIDAKKIAAVAQSDKNDLEDVVRNTTGGRGCDVALNVVGAPLFTPLLNVLAHRGRMAIISGASGRVVERFDLLDLYRRDLSIVGVNTAADTFTVADTAKILTELYAPFQAGQIEPVRATARFPLSEAPEAYARIAKTSGEKIVLVP